MKFKLVIYDFAKGEDIKSEYNMPEKASEKLKKGLIKPEDIPYMQDRWDADNSDLKKFKLLVKDKFDLFTI